VKQHFKTQIVRRRSFHCNRTARVLSSKEEHANRKTLNTRLRFAWEKTKATLSIKEQSNSLAIL
jgi:hypothetical protein